MKKSCLENNRGNVIIKIILLILVSILVVFLAYEIVFNDVFGIMGDIDVSKLPISLDEVKNSFSSDNRKTEDVEGNMEVVTPIIDEGNGQNTQTTVKINKYYYNQLDEYAKIIYKGLEDNIENMQSGTYKIDFNTQFNDLLNSENGEKKLGVAFQSAWNAFTYDYVDIFYIDVSKLILTTKTTKIGKMATHKVYVSNGDNETYLSDDVMKISNLQDEIKQLANKRNIIVAQLNGYSQYDQVKYLHDWLINTLKYDTTYKKDNIHNVYGAFKNQEVVCEGYARTFKYILDGLGIESVLVSGNATNSTGATESHAWNYVKINDKWYAIDVTWDDPIIVDNGELTESLRYKYFLCGSNTFFKNHKEDGYLSENSMKFTFPSLEKENY